jgi:hypothetical protein
MAAERRGQKKKKPPGDGRALPRKAQAACAWLPAPVAAAGSHRPRQLRTLYGTATARGQKPLLINQVTRIIRASWRMPALTT